VLPGAVAPGATVAGALEITPSGRDGSLGAATAGAAPAGRVPAETELEGSTPAGGAGARPVVVRTLGDAPSELPDVTKAELPASSEVDVEAEAEAAAEERAATGAGRSRSGEGSSG
jgi:hypothetical protein